MSTAIQVSRSDIIGLCRLCLAKDLAEIDIFETGSEYRQLFTKIVTCLPVEVTQNEDLPTRICEVCNSKVDNFYQFWTSTAKNQKQLQEWLKTATDEIKKTDITTIKVEADDPRGEDYEPEDYDDDHRGDSYDEEEDAPSAPKRIKIQHSSDIEEDTKPSKLVLDSASNGASTSKTKKSTKETWTGEISKAEWKELVKNKSKDCPWCEDRYRTHDDLKKHVKKTHLNQTQCPICDTKLARKVFLKRHLAVVHAKKPPKYYECHHCGQCFTRRKTFCHHIWKHIDLSSLYCKTCDKKFPTQPKLKAHLKSHNRGEYFAQNDGPDTGDISLEVWEELKKAGAVDCPMCGKHFKTPHEMRTHLRRVHTSGKKHECEICKKKFKSRENYMEHKKLLHLGQRVRSNNYNYGCSECGAKYKCRTTLAEHMAIHTGVKPHVCEICGLGFASKRGLERHHKVHLKNSGLLREEDMFKCDECGKLYMEKGHLTSHKKWDHGDAYILCKVCGKKIKRNLKRHMMMHTGERPYCCPICGIRLRGKLKDHMLTHSDARPFACDVCGSTFKRKRDVKLHMRKHGDQSVAAPGGKKCQICMKNFQSEEALNNHVLEHF